MKPNVVPIWMRPNLMITTDPVVQLLVRLLKKQRSR
jgi:hypothetical protein